MPGQIINRSTGKSPTYQVRVPLGRDPSGKRIYLNKTIHGTKREAELFLADQLRKRDMGEELRQHANRQRWQNCFKTRWRIQDSMGS